MVPIDVKVVTSFSPKLKSLLDQVLYIPCNDDKAIVALVIPVVKFTKLSATPYSFSTFGGLYIFSLASSRALPSSSVTIVFLFKVFS
jgi:hypothetical protein